MSSLICTEGVVLRVTPFQDRHLILTALTAAQGKVALFAKGARGARSRFGPEIDLLSRSEFVYLDAKNVKPLRDVTLVHYYPALKVNYDHLTSALKAAKLLNRLVHEGQADLKTLQLFTALLEVLDRAEVPVALYELAYTLRLLDTFGVGPHLGSCLRCDRHEGPWWFSLSRGGLMCEGCHHLEDVPLEAGLARTLRALRVMAWGKLERVRLNPRQLETSQRLLDRFLAFHVRPSFTAKAP